MAIVDFRVVVRFDCSFFTAYPRVFIHSDSTPGSRQVLPLFLSSPLPCVLYGADSTPDNSRISYQRQLGYIGGNGGYSMFQLRGYPRGYVCSVCILCLSCLVCAFFVSCIFCFQAAESHSFE